MPQHATEDRSPLADFDPAAIHQLFLGLDVPDPITFVVSPHYLNRPNLYPRQATLLKCFFLREDLFTDYDYAVVAEWDEQYRTAKTTNEQRASQDQLDVVAGLDANEDAPKMPLGGTPALLQRMRAAKALGYKWFREVLLVMGRRAGKGYLSALAMTYVLWHYMAKGDPQEFYGVDRDKKLTALIFAGKRDQAKQNLWRDYVNVVTGAPCFAPFIAKSIGEKLSVYAPHDFVRMDDLARRGVTTELDMATFEILPKESTLMAGRGPASFIIGFDEMAHVVASGANRSAGEVYDAATPSLDQFGKDGFIIEPSSPWEMTGKFFENYERAVELEPDGTPAYPAVMMIQLASWDMYLDWQNAHELPLFPDGFTGDNDEYADEEPPGFRAMRGAIQTYDEQMRKLEKADPDTFAVERRAQWATVLDAYLDPDKVEKVFSPWRERPAQYGGPLIIPPERGILAYVYKGHADPSSVNCRFGIALAHVEHAAQDGQTRPHAVFDKIHYFDPADFPDHTIDYEQVEDWIWDEIIAPYQPEEFTFDQYNCLSMDTLVPTPFGLLKLHEVIGNLPIGKTKKIDVPVQSMDGVERAMEAHHKGDVPTLRFRTRHGVDLVCTPEHRILVRKAKDKPWHSDMPWEWKQASEIETGDHLRLQIGSVSPSEQVDLTSYHPAVGWGISPHLGVTQENGRWLAYGRQEGKTIRLAYCATEAEAAEVARQHREQSPTALGSIRFPKTLDAPLAHVLGLMVSEGNVGKNHFQFSNKDKSVLQTFCEDLTTTFGRQSNYLYDEQWKGRYQCGWVRGSVVMTKFLKAVGLDSTRSQDKTVPWSVRRSPHDIVGAFLAGLFEGDGGVKIVGPNDEEVLLTTTSEQLSEEVQQLLHAMGILTTRWHGSYTYKGERRPQWRVKVFGKDIVTFREKVGFLSPTKSKKLDQACDRVILRQGSVVDRNKKVRGDTWYFDRVTLIEDAGETDCYDISVPGPESFIGNGIVVHNSVSSIQKLVKKVARHRLPKRVTVFERTATNAINWKYAETFKAAINMGLVHAPPHEEGELELKFLQKPPNIQRVDHPTVGPVQTKDIADAIMITTWSLIGDWIAGYKEMLNQANPVGAMQGGLHGSSPRSPADTNIDRTQQETIDALRSFSRTRMGRDQWERNLGRHRTGYRRG